MALKDFYDAPPFLKWSAKKIIDQSQVDLLDTVIILPSRRACNIMRDYLVDTIKVKYKTPAQFIPELIPINEFWTHLSGFTIPDKDILLLELFNIYKKHWSETIEFEDFLPWGRMMLTDFDEIDKYLVNAQKLFTIIQDEKEIEAMFSIDVELKEIMAHFWKSMEGGKEYEKRFTATWKVLGIVYQEYAQTLKEKRIAYEGLAYKTLFNRLEKAKIVTLPYKEIHFVGFNAFATVDERIIDQLSELKDVSVKMYWDTDEYFMKKKSLQKSFEHEAGNFLRKYKDGFNRATHYWNEAAALSNQKKYHLHGAPLYQGQVKLAAKFLSEILNDENSKETVGIILSEESMLEALLYEVENMEKVNITMSMSVGDAALTDWLEILYNINSQESIHLGDLNRLYKHYYFKIIVPIEDADKFKNNIIESSSFYFSKKIVSKYIDQIFIEPNTKLNTLNNLCKFWLDALETLSNKIERKGQKGKLDIIISYYKKAILEKQLVLSQFESQISFEAIYLLLLSHIKSIAIPFLSEQQERIQIMGFLESRLIDFDRVIILGANEEILPHSKRGNSYIPYSLRRFFKLPTLKEYDGVYAYHFFRLLKRSRRADLIYNNVPGEAPFERSRFLRQIELELNQPSNQIVNKNWSYPIIEHTNLQENNGKGIIIPKKPEHIEVLRKMTFSTSGLDLYLRCPVQFYLQYIAGIREEREIEEVIDSGHFGEVLHKAIELFYQDHKDQLLTPDIIKNQIKNLNGYLNKAFEENYQSHEELTGQNLLAYDVILQSLKNIIDSDIHLASKQPFRIVGIEEKIINTITLSDGNEVYLKGIIDRIDDLGDHLRIIDYKTGKVSLLSDNSFIKHKIKNIFNRHNAKPNSQTFQGLFYHYLKEKQEASVGFYSIRELNEGVKFLNKGQPIPEDIQAEFQDQLKLLLEEIMDPEIPFVQNTDPDAYLFSPFNFTL